MTKRVLLIAKVFLYAYAMSAVATIAVALAAYLVIGPDAADQIIFKKNLHLYLIPPMTAIYLKLFKWRETTKLDRFAVFILALTALVTFIAFAISFVVKALTPS